MKFNFFGPDSGKPRYVGVVYFLLFLELVGCKNKKIPKVNSHFAQILKRAACWWNSNFPSHIIPSQEMAVDVMQRSQITHLLAPGGEICGLEILLEDICPKFYTASKLLKLLMSSYGLNLIWEMTNIYETIFTSGDESPLKTQISRSSLFVNVNVCVLPIADPCGVKNYQQDLCGAPLRKLLLLGHFLPHPLGIFLGLEIICISRYFPGLFKLFLRALWRAVEGCRDNWWAILDHQL